LEKLERIVDEEQARMIRQNKRYKLSNRYVKMISVLLAPKEYVVLGARQSFPRTLSPGLIVATNKRVLIVKQSFWGLYSGHNIVSPSIFANIHYKKMTEISLKNGRLFCSIVIRVLGDLLCHELDLRVDLLIEKHRGPR
jgi:hypothetical protein